MTIPIPPQPPCSWRADPHRPHWWSAVKAPDGSQYAFIASPGAYYCGGVLDEFTQAMLNLALGGFVFEQIKEN